MKVLLLLTLLLFNSPSLISQIFPIDNYFQAYFPGKPTLLLNNKQLKMVSYSYTDEANVIIYNATYSVLDSTVKQKERKEFLSYLLDGHIKSLNGKLVKKEFIKLDKNDAIIYTIKYLQHDEPINKYGVSVLKDKVIYNWAVQEITTYSLIQAEDIFKTKLKYFKILK